MLGLTEKGNIYVYDINVEIENNGESKYIKSKDSNIKASLVDSPK